MPPQYGDQPSSYLEPAVGHVNPLMKKPSIDNPTYESIDLPISGLESHSSTRPNQHQVLLEVVQRDPSDESNWNSLPTQMETSAEQVDGSNKRETQSMQAPVHETRHHEVLGPRENVDNPMYDEVK